MQHACNFFHIYNKVYINLCQFYRLYPKFDNAITDASYAYQFDLIGDTGNATTDKGKSRGAEISR